MVFRSRTSVGAIAQLKVVDLSRVFAGPYCTQILADHGAEVIKIEPPFGDETRHWGPPFRDGRAAYFDGINRNKRSMGLDLTKITGREVLSKLLESADILLENFKPGTMESWGLGYDSLRARFPRLIYCRISGFGSHGPLGGRPGYDAVLQAMCGLMAVNGDHCSGPMRTGIPVVDMACGLYAAIGILMAVIERQSSGLGDCVNVTLFDTAFAINHPHVANFLMSGVDPSLSGNAHPNISPYDKFNTATCDVFVGIGNDRAFVQFCNHLNRADVAVDSRFTSNAERVRNRDDLNLIICKALREVDGKEFAARLLREGLPVGSVNTVGEAIASEHAEHRQSIVKDKDYRGVATPIRFFRSQSVGLKHAPPAFTQHARDILLEHGYEAKEIEALITTAAVSGADKL